MELVDGETLRTWLRRPRRWREVLKVLIDVGRGIAAAHAVDVVHGDIKPENVMIAADGRARVMDFGVARAEPSADEVGETFAAGTLDRTDELNLDVSGERSRLRGTPSYMAPEQWRTRRTDAASDQFAFCVMAWEALLGARPYAEDEVMSVDDVRRLRPRARVPARVPAWLRRVLTRGLAGRPTDRFAGMDALVAALSSGQARRRRTLVAASAVALALGLGAAAGGSAWQEQQRVAACVADGASFAAEVWTAEARQSTTRARRGVAARAGGRGGGARGGVARRVLGALAGGAYGGVHRGRRAAAGVPGRPAGARRAACHGVAESRRGRPRRSRSARWRRCRTRAAARTRRRCCDRRRQAPRRPSRRNCARICGSPR
jgi:hypothetical protein